MRAGISRFHSSSIVLLAITLGLLAACGKPPAQGTAAPATTVTAGASLPLVVAATTPTRLSYPYLSGTATVVTLPATAMAPTRTPLAYPFPSSTPHATSTTAPSRAAMPTWTPRPTCTPVHGAEGAAAASGQAPAFTVEMLRNGEYRYRSAFGGRTVKLVDGKYEERGEHPLLTEQVIFVNDAFGDLQGDGIEDAVVELRYRGGGTGHFPGLVAMLNEQGKPVQVATASLGDRERVLSLSIKDGVVTAEMLTHGQGDGMCCPSQPDTRRFRLDCNKLVRLP
jgi:hypothetical protein